MSDDEHAEADRDLGSVDARKHLSPAAKRALEEAEARRAVYRAAEADRPTEIGGRGGLEPGRYGDWEIKGLTSDF
ncbi:MAG: DUF1674 domain-containing protein [Mesorhizobium sp.]|jgi:hypothetical protein